MSTDNNHGTKPYVAIMAEMTRIARLSDTNITNRALLDAALAILREVR